MSSIPTRVGLIFGGASGEHAVSIRSAATVAAALRSGANASRYQLSCFYIDQQGRWGGPELADAVLAQGSPAHPEQLASNKAPAGFRGFPPGADEIGVWLPILHGPNGEDGTIQGLFTLMQVPFVGSGVLGSAVGMDKQAMKAAFAAAGLPQVPYCCATAQGLRTNPDALVRQLESELGYPCFVKPANLGSSVGISKASDRASLLAGLEAAAQLDSRLVIEQGVIARELECAVRGGGTLGGFALAGADGRFVWAKARIDGGRVLVEADGVAEPVEVVYAWQNNPVPANLVNGAGLPAVPFRAKVAP